MHYFPHFFIFVKASLLQNLEKPLPSYFALLPRVLSLVVAEMLYLLQ